MGAARNMGDVSGEICNLVKPFVPSPLLELARTDEREGLEVLPNVPTEFTSFDRQLDVRVQLGLDEPERPEIEVEEILEILRGRFLVREDLLKFYSGGLDMQPRPYIHNHVIELVDAERATGRCYLDLRSLKNDMGWLGAGYYNDEYRKEGGVWKFAERSFVVVKMLEDPTGQDR